MYKTDQNEETSLIPSEYRSNRPPIRTSANLRKNRDICMKLDTRVSGNLKGWR